MIAIPLSSLIDIRSAIVSAIANLPYGEQRFGLHSAKGALDFYIQTATRDIALEIDQTEAPR